MFPGIISTESNTMKREYLKLNKMLTYLFVGAAILFTLNAIIPKYPGLVILPNYVERREILMIRK